MEIAGNRSSVEALGLHYAEIPLEIHENFSSLDYTPLFYCSYADKLGNSFHVSRRLVLLTLDQLFVCHLNGDILRCVAFADIAKIFVDSRRNHIGLVIPDEFDMAIGVPDPHLLVHSILALHRLHKIAKPIDVEELPAPSPVGTSGHEERSTALLIRTATQDDDHMATENGRADDDDDDDAAEDTAGGGDHFRHVRVHGSSTSRNCRRDQPTSSTASSSWWTSVKRTFGWDPQNLSGSGGHRWFTGDPTSYCVGRGYYQLRLRKPPGFVVRLDRRNQPLAPGGTTEIGCPSPPHSPAAPDSSAVVTSPAPSAVSVEAAKQTTT